MILPAHSDPGMQKKTNQVLDIPKKTPTYPSNIMHRSKPPNERMDVFFFFTVGDSDLAYVCMFKEKTCWDILVLLSSMIYSNASTDPSIPRYLEDHPN